ncbi:ABC transporter permease [Enemella sp. A6]|uniref:ABC transporter permease n=1 Tax=Enemella sp. A6 TaxID=3440152 RepID=UPI003EBC33C8
MDHNIADLSLSEVSKIAKTAGMRQVGHRPPFGAYIRDLWQRRSFLWTLSSARSLAKNEGQRFGQLWAFINPLLLIATYLFIFGLLLRTGRGIDNFVGYLAIGVVLFGLSASTLTSGSRAIVGNTGLVRALHFPRALLPLAVVLTEVLALLPGLLVLVVVLPLTGERPMWSWLLFPVAIVLQGLMQAGMVLILARIVNASADVWNLIPVAVRLGRYVSGVFFSISAMTANWPVVGAILDNQPLALQLTIARQALMGEFELSWTPWLVSIAWAIVLPVVGLWVFWRDEARYGRG